MKENEKKEIKKIKRKENERKSKKMKENERKRKKKKAQGGPGVSGCEREASRKGGGKRGGVSAPQRGALGRGGEAAFRRPKGVP